MTSVALLLLVLTLMYCISGNGSSSQPCNDMRPTVPPKQQEVFEQFLKANCSLDCSDLSGNDIIKYYYTQCNCGIKCNYTCTVPCQMKSCTVPCQMESCTPIELPACTLISSATTTTTGLADNETAPPTNSLSTIIIVSGTLAVVLILALLVTIVIILWIVFRYKTARIQQRYEDPPNMERYVSKEPESLPTAENRDPMYDIIDDTTIAMKAHHQTASFHKGSQPPLPPATHSSNRIPMNNGSAQITTGIDNHVYFKGSPESPTIEPVLPYEEPVSALNSFHLSSEKETTSSSKTETFNETKTTFQHQQKMKPEQLELEPAKTIKRELVSADYAILEGPGHIRIKGDENSPATVNNNRIELSQNTNQEPTMDASIADYSVLEGPTPSDTQPYKCPDPRAVHSTHSAGEANGTEPSASRSIQNNSSGTLNTVQPVYATLEPANMNTEESSSKYTTLNKN